MIGRRIARLPGPGRCVLQAGAALGMEFEPLVLTTAERVVDGLAAAVGAGLLTQVGERRYTFPHALIRETVLADMSPSRKACMHLRIADVLAEQGGHAGEIAKHVRAAGDVRAARAADRGGARRRPPGRGRAGLRRRRRRTTRPRWRRRRPGRAATGRRRGVPTRRRAGGRHAATRRSRGRRPRRRTDRAEILLALGAAHDRAGNRAAAQAAFDEVDRARARARATRCCSPARRSAAAASACSWPPPTRRHAPARGGAGAAARARARLAARLRARLAIEFYYSDHDKAEALSARAVEDARAADDPSALAAALNARRVALWTPERIEERLDVSTEMIEAAEAAGDREGVLQGRNWRVVDLMELGERDALEREIAAYEELADAVGLAHYRWYVPLWRSALAQLEGRWAEAEALGREALALADRAGDPMAPWLVRVQIECTLEAQGRLAEVDRDELVEQAKASAEPWSWLSYVAYLDAVTGHTDRARQALRELVADGGAKLPSGLNWHVLAYVAETAATVGDREAAELLYATLEPHARLFPVVARGGDLHRLHPVLPRPASRTRSDAPTRPSCACAARSPRTCGSAPARARRSRWRGSASCCSSAARSSAAARRCAKPPRRRTSWT